MKRRQFTTSMAALACLSASSSLPALVAFSGSTTRETGEGLLSRQRFEARLGQRFTGTGSAETRLRLDAVDSAVSGYEKQQFHVSFSAPAGQTLPEGIYYLESNGKPQFALHMIPGEITAGRQRMIATVNLQRHA